MKKRLIFALLMLIPLTLCAQTRKISGVYTYYSDPTQSPKEAMAAAIENAKAQALAKEFGTLIVQSSVEHMEQKNGQEKDVFSQLNMSEVKGEWIEDLKEPEAKITAYMPDGVLVIEAKVSGKARPLSSEQAEFETYALRNGTEKRFADENFKSGDDFFLYFKAPVDGYVAVYMVENNQTVSCMLPYKADGDGQQSVKHGKEYIFFSPNHEYDIPKSRIDEFTMMCDDIEHDQLYVIFSPNPFVKAVDEQKQASEEWQQQKLVLPRQLSPKDFTRWLGRLAAKDPQLGKKVIRIVIKND